MMKGTLSTIAVPGQGTLARYTRQVISNDGFGYGDRVRLSAARSLTRNPVPVRVGESSPIKHVIYIVRENRTYDQEFGSLGKGNGDPALNLFGNESAPNSRTLESRFVTLDNFYANAEVSARAGTGRSAPTQTRMWNRPGWGTTRGAIKRMTTRVATTRPP
jgi:hypothetical protein